MSTFVVPPIRQTMKTRVANFFTERLGEKIPSRQLHAMFGSAVRTRISDINLDDAAVIQIFNEVVTTPETERSYYWAELKHCEAGEGSN